MKWRNLLIYFVVLVVLAGWYYYYDVVEKDRKEAAEAEQKRVFSFDPDKATELVVRSAEGGDVHLVNDGQWRVTEPRDAEADQGAVKALLNALSTLDSERKVVDKPEDLAPFGLDHADPLVKFKTGDAWLQLAVGGKNPAGDANYARAGEDGPVLLIASSSRETLNKGFRELRRRNLFTFQSDQIDSMRVEWQGYTPIVVEKKEHGDWSTPERPGFKVSNDKVMDVIDRLQWLRAKDFTDIQPDRLDEAGLKPATVTLTLHMDGGDDDIRLLLSDKDEKQKEATAWSSELPFIVKINPEILGKIPKNLTELEDRSIFSIKNADIKRVTWNLAGTSRAVVKTGDDKWGEAKDSGEPAELKEPWRVQSLFWSLQDAEYLDVMDAAPEPAPELPNRLEFAGESGQLLALNWGPAPEGAKTPDLPPDKAASAESALEPSAAEDASGGPLWMRIDRGDSTQWVYVSAKTADQISHSLGEVLPATK